MSVLRKVPARAGVQWVLGSLLLLRCAPLALGKLGAMWALATMLVLTISTNIHAFASVGPYLILLAVPLFMGGLLWAVREVDYGRTPQPFHLLAGVYGERPIHLLMFLFPQFMASLLSIGVLLLVLGVEGIQQMTQAIILLGPVPAFNGTFEPSQVQALLTPLPFGSLLLWLAWGGLIFVMLMLILWVMLPLVMFENINGLRALRYSLKPIDSAIWCAGAWGSIYPFSGIDNVKSAVEAQMLAGVLGVELAVLLARLVLIAVLMPLVAGAMYAAWKHMLAPDDLPPPPLPRNLIQV